MWNSFRSAIVFRVFHTKYDSDIVTLCHMNKAGKLYDFAYPLYGKYRIAV
jgi:hypothetical protein